jgi:branched-chain amino acid transport system ATP-binding protein
MTLKIKNVSAGYGPVDVVHDINLDVRPGEIVTLVGANGAGKSTLAKVISGLIPCRKGAIELDEVRIDRKSTAERMRLGVVHIPEGRQVFSGLSVNENLQLGGYLDRRHPAELARRRSEVLAAFPVLTDRLAATAGNLSGGQQQMLAIGRGLMSRPKLLILDEPSLGLAPLIVAEIFRLIVRMRERGLSILLSEQNAQQSLGIADRGYVLENGRVALSGTGKDLLQSREVVDRYLGIGTGSADLRGGSDLLSSQLRGLLESI